MGWDGMGLDGMRCDETGRDARLVEVGVVVADRVEALLELLLGQIARAIPN